MKDLFNCHKTPKEFLLEEIQKRRYMKTSDVLRWGLENYSNRADRNMRLLAAEKYVRRMSEDQKKRLYGPIHEDVWEVI